MVELRNVTKSFSGGWLNQMNYQFNKIGLYGVIGHTEERKTLLKLIGMEDFDFEGSILYHGKNILPHDTHTFLEKNISVLSQIELEENKSIIGNLKNKDVSESEIEKDLKKFGFEGKEKKRLKTLTEEEKNIIRFLKAIEPTKELYLIDETNLKLSTKYQKKAWQKLEQKSKKSLIIIGLSKKRAIENITYLRLENGNLLDLPEELETKKVEAPKKEEKKMTKEKRVTSIFFFAFIFFFLFTGLTFQTINKDSIHYETLIHENSNEIFLKIKGNTITQEEIDEMRSYAQVDFGKTYSEIGTFMGLSGKKAVSSSDYPIFYNAIMSIPVFYVVNDQTKLDLLIGTAPMAENEIVISKTVADFILYKGILTTDNTFYEPKTYEEIINSGSNISYGGIPVKIVGITNQDLENIDTWKAKKESELSKEEYYSFQDFVDRNENYHDTYVNEFFGNYVRIRGGKNITESISEIRVVTDEKEKLKEIIEKYANSNITIKSIVSTRLAKYESLFKTLKIIGGVLTFLFILCFFLQLIYVIIDNTRDRKKESEVGRELIVLLTLGSILGFLLHLGYTSLINNFISHKLFIYFHVLEIHLFPILLIVICTFTIALCLNKYFHNEMTEK